MKASDAQQHHHRSSLSQSNKPFKARHATKGSLKQIAKGRLQKESNHSLNSKLGKSAFGQKAARRNYAKQLLIEKARAQAASQRIFSGPDPAPRVIAILALSPDIDLLSDILSPIRQLPALADHHASIDPNSHTQTLLWSNSSRSSTSLLQFLLVPHGTQIEKVLSIIAASDFLISALSAVEECTSWGETALRAIQALGGPNIATLGLVCHLDSLATLKDSQKTRESLASFLRYFFPDTLLLNRIISIEKAEEISSALRSILSKQLNSNSNGRLAGWRDGRARLVAEQILWQDQTLKVTGYVRGGRFSANRLVHIPFLGDYQLSMITIGDHNQIASMKVIEEADDLVSENVPSVEDQLMAEQTWPTEEEIANAPANRLGSNLKKRTRRVPVGTSDYQAAWIVEPDDVEDDEIENLEDQDIQLDGQEDNSDHQIDHDSEEEEEEMEELQVNDQPSSSKEVHFVDLPDETEQADLAQYRADRQRERDRAKEDEEFPDEIDTPLDIPARQRFARYRGMKSFRTSEWDPYENLPIEYGKVFGFEGWKTMGRKLNQRANEQEAGVAPGMRVTLHLEQFSSADFQTLSASSNPLVIFSLLKHEHKYSVMHFTTQRNTEFEGDIKSKDPLIVCVGFRFYNVQPIWSQPSLRATNNVHKFERYLRPGRMNVATVYMPVTFGSTTPVLVLKPNKLENRLELVGNGTLIGSDPKRIVAKRIILTGHPYKIHKKTATIRYMFFSREDIEYFKPIELKTKKGKTGHIKEALGTHGYFKAGFDKMIDQMDTVCMNLYKRCFPKWATGWRGAIDQKQDESMDVDEMK
ncbi:hypothetical protein O181_014854 [Austropuccinia psidii MF-1]|uniref:Bms1-type G domain-containing protein n=1 Tax=Austropuccinia psidii MF-1 TaxID=1389203 RepID=A0A9Q3BYW9_9BASI|nr:hypothetical protein [Austropuccinia psidii MF-1]